MALKTARPEPTQKGPVFPLTELDPPKASIMGGKARRQPDELQNQKCKGRRLTPGTDESTDLANGSSDTVELTTDGGGTSLCGKHTETVSGTHLTERQEDTVYNGEGTNVADQMGVETAHEESNKSLEQQASDHAPLGPNKIDDEGATKSTGHVEQAVGHVVSLITPVKIVGVRT